MMQEGTNKKKINDGEQVSREKLYQNNTELYQKSEYQGIQCCRKVVSFSTMTR